VPPAFAHDDTPQTKFDKLDALLAQTSTSRQDAALLAEMLSLPNDGRYPTLDLTPEQRRQKTLQALGAQLETLACSSPVLMILEDAHFVAAVATSPRPGSDIRDGYFIGPTQSNAWKWPITAIAQLDC
jgi:hypothetical protein